LQAGLVQLTRLQQEAGKFSPWRSVEAGQAEDRYHRQVE